MADDDSDGDDKLTDDKMYEAKFTTLSTRAQFGRIVRRGRGTGGRRVARFIS